MFFSIRQVFRSSCSGLGLIVLLLEAAFDFSFWIHRFLGLLDLLLS